MCSVQYGFFFIVPCFRFLLLLLKIYSRLLVSRWRSPGKSRTQQEIKAIYPIALRMISALSISVIFSTLLAYGWPGSNITLADTHFGASNVRHVSGRIWPADSKNSTSFFLSALVFEIQNIGHISLFTLLAHKKLWYFNVVFKLTKQKLKNTELINQEKL